MHDSSYTENSIADSNSREDGLRIIEISIDQEEHLEPDPRSTLHEDWYSSLLNRVENFVTTQKLLTPGEENYQDISEGIINEEQQQNQQKSDFTLKEHELEERENRINLMEKQLQEQLEESSMEREKLSAWIQDNKQTAQQLETQQKEITERERECSEKERSLSARIHDNEQKACQLEAQEKELAERECECNEKERCLKAWEAKFQAHEEKWEVIQANTLVSQSIQTNQLDTKTDDASVHANIRIPHHTQESGTEADNNNVNIAVQANVSISKTSPARRVIKIHQHQSHQDAAAQTTMDIPQSCQPFYSARPAHRNSHDKAVQVNIPQPASTSPSEPHLLSCCQETKKQMHSTFMTNMTNCKRGIITALYNTEVSELTYP